jgi:hypothetical protein
MSQEPYQGASRLKTTLLTLTLQVQNPQAQKVLISPLLKQAFPVQTQNLSLAIHPTHLTQR